MKLKPTKYDGYYAGEDGFIYSMERTITHKNGHTQRLKTKVLKNQFNDRGYAQVRMAGKYVVVARIVAEAWLNNPDNLPQVRHINQIRHDNRPVNLMYASPKDTHYYKKGTLKGRTSIEEMERRAYEEARQG